jgi:ATP-dependent protease ClpP protease subunit
MTVARVCVRGEIDAARARAFQLEIDAARDRDSRALLVEIDSRGGGAMAGFGMVEALHDFSGPTIAHVSNLAASAASILALEADCLVIGPSGRLHIHDPSGGDVGDPEDRIARGIIRGRALEVYERRTYVRREMLKAWMARYGQRDGTPVFADESVGFGFSDEVGTLDRAEDLAEQAAQHGRVWLLTRGRMLRRPRAA